MTGDPGAQVAVLVEREAARKGVELSGIPGTGSAGRITLADVRAATATIAPTWMHAQAPAISPLVPLAELRRWTRRRPVGDPTEVRTQDRDGPARSYRPPSLRTALVEIDVTAVVDVSGRLGAEFSARTGCPLSVAHFVAYALAGVLPRHPRLGSPTAASGASANLVVSRPDAALRRDVLIEQADRLSFAGLVLELESAEESVAGQAEGPRGGIFALSMVEDGPALIEMTGAPSPPSTSLSVGAPIKRAVVRTLAGGSDSIAIRTMVYAALTYDSGTIDRHNALEFLGQIKGVLEDAQWGSTALGHRVRDCTASA